MLKLIALFLVTLGLVSAAPKSLTVEDAWRIIPITQKGVQCLYVDTLRMFSCRGVDVTVEPVTCPAVRHLDTVPHKLFGLSRLPVVKDQIHYGMYPKVALPDNTTSYMENTWMTVNTTTDVTPVPICVYYEEKMTDFGIRVTDKNCFNRISHFLDKIVDEHKVTLSTPAETDPVVSLIGEVFIVEPTQERRSFGRGGLLGGGGILGPLLLLSLLSPGFGFGGFGGGFGGPLIG